MYNYQTERKYVFTEEGQVQFLRIRDKVKNLLNLSGAVRMDKAIGGETGNSWGMLACVDRLVELKELEELTDKNTAGQGQFRVFISTVR